MNTRWLQGIVLAGVVALAACAQPATMGTADEETALRGMGAKYADLFNKNDASGLAAMVTEDYQAIQPDGTTISGRAKFEESEKAQIAERTAAGLTLKLDVKTSLFKWTSATSAVAGGTWTMAGIPPGMGADHGAWQVTFLKGADAKWLMYTALVSEYHAPPAPPTAPTEMKKGK